MRRNRTITFRIVSMLQGIIAAIVGSEIVRKLMRTRAYGIFGNTVCLVMDKAVIPAWNGAKMVRSAIKRREIVLWGIVWLLCAGLGVAAITGTPFIIKAVAGGMVLLALSIAILRNPLLGLGVFVLFAPLMNIAIRSDIPGLSSDRVIVVVLLIAFIMQIRKEWKWESLPLLHTCMILFAAVMLIEAFRADQVRSGLSLVVSGYVFPIFMYFFARRWVSDEKTLNNVFTWILISGFYFALLGIPEHFLHHTIFRPTVWVEKELGTVRIQGPATSPTEFGVAVAGAILIAVARFAIEPLKSKKFWYAVGIAVSLLAILLTLRRSVYIGLAMSLAVMLACYQPIRRVVAWCLILGSLALAIGANPLMHSKYYNSRIGDKGPLYSREIMQSTAVEVFKAHPISGVGVNRFKSEIPKYFKSYHKILVYHAYGLGSPHNQFLRIAAEGGLIALIPFVGLLALIFSASIRAYRRTTTRGLSGRDGIVLYWALSAVFLAQSLQGDSFFFCQYSSAVWFLITGAVFGVHFKKANAAETQESATQGIVRRMVALKSEN